LSDLKKLYPYIKPHFKTLTLIILLGFVMSGAAVATAPLAKLLFGEVFENKNASLMYVVPLSFVGIYFINGIARFFHMYLLKFTGEQIVADIRSDLQRKFMTLNLGFHGRYEAGSGGLLSRILNDMVVLQWGLNILVDCIREPVTVLGLLAYMFYLNWKLTAFTLIVAPVIIITLKQLAKSIRKYSYKQQESMEVLTSNLKETLDGVRIIQSFSLENEMVRRLKVVLADYLGHRSKIIAREEAAGPISEFAGALVFSAICIYIANQIIGGQSTLAEFLAFLVALAQFQPPIKKLQDAHIRLQQTVAATSRLFQILEDHNEVPQTKSCQMFPTHWDSVKFENVSFKYDDERMILNHISLEVKKGEVVALVGESGSGKSTLVNLLGRFFEPTEGKIKIGDTSVDEIQLDELRKNIALVSQEVFLFNDTVRFNIQSGDLTKNISADDVAKTANAYDFIQSMPQGMDTKIGDRGSRASGGEKQRLSIARALYKDAPILILDEATSALDSASEVEVQKGLDRLMKGRTVFVIAHRLSTVIHADRILVLKNGKVIEEGRHDDLLTKNGAYAHFFKLQTLR